MATVSVKATGPLASSGGGTLLKENIFVIVTLGNPNLGRTPHNQTLPLNTEVIVDSRDIRGVWDTSTSSWSVVIPAGILLSVNIGGALKIAETAQPIQVTGPAISILDLES